MNCVAAATFLMASGPESIFLPMDLQHVEQPPSLTPGSLLKLDLDFLLVNLSITHRFVKRV
jgi:hypothetical protein